jgi:tRNA modification GTPase
MAGIDGGLQQRIGTLRERLLDQLAELEARVDFEEDLPPLDAAAVVAELEAVRAALQQFVTEARQGELLREGLRVAIVGRPNVGKSSLLNLLSQRQKAIVTDLPGTTRDLLESELVLDGVPLTLLDTAGIRPTSDRVEQLGIARSREALAAADAVLLLFDLSAGWTVEDEALRALAPEGAVLLVAGNKADAAALPVGLVPPGDGARAPADVSFSAVSGAGRDDLVAELLRRCGAGSLEGVQVALNARQRDLAGAAALSLEASLEAAGQQLPWDFWTIDLRAAVRCLGEITGAEVSEAVLDRVFSRFCIGK